MSKEGFKIAIIGCGGIGCQAARSCVQLAIENKVKIELVLINRLHPDNPNIKKAKVAADEIKTEYARHHHYAHFKQYVTLKAESDYAHLKGAHAVINAAGITAGAIGANSREASLLLNLYLSFPISTAINKHCPESFVISCTNPTDEITDHFARKCPQATVLGLGTSIDTDRFHMFLREELGNHGIEDPEIEGYIIGYHNEKGMILDRSTVKINNQPVDEHSPFAVMVNSAFKKTTTAGMDLVKESGGQGATLNPGYTLAIAVFAYHTGEIAPGFMMHPTSFSFMHHDGKIDNSGIVSNEIITIRKGKITILETERHPSTTEALHLKQANFERGIAQWRDNLAAMEEVDRKVRILKHENEAKSEIIFPPAVDCISAIIVDVIKKYEVLSKEDLEKRLITASNIADNTDFKSYVDRHLNSVSDTLSYAQEHNIELSQDIIEKAFINAIQCSHIETNDLFDYIECKPIILTKSTFDSCFAHQDSHAILLDYAQQHKDQKYIVDDAVLIKDLFYCLENEDSTIHTIKNIFRIAKQQNLIFGKDVITRALQISNAYNNNFVSINTPQQLPLSVTQIMKLDPNINLQAHEYRELNKRTILLTDYLNAHYPEKVRANADKAISPAYINKRRRTTTERSFP